MPAHHTLVYATGSSWCRSSLREWVAAWHWSPDQGSAAHLLGLYPRPVHTALRPCERPASWLWSSDQGSAARCSWGTSLRERAAARHWSSDQGSAARLFRNLSRLCTPPRGHRGERVARHWSSDQGSAACLSRGLLGGPSPQAKAAVARACGDRASLARLPCGPFAPMTALSLSPPVLLVGPWRRGDCSMARAPIGVLPLLARRRISNARLQRMHHRATSLGLARRGARRPSGLAWRGPLGVPSHKVHMADPMPLSAPVAKPPWG